MANCHNKPTTACHAYVNSNILVAGGAGFTESHLCSRLLRDGHHVVCVDSFVTGLRSNIEKLNRSTRFSFEQCDITKPLTVAGSFEEIYNLACPASPAAYQADPIHTLKTSVLGSLNLLEFARQHGAKIFHASTSEIYGDPLHHPQTETDWGNVNPIGPRGLL
jgi:UDP-glucuronate decarboxylase